MSEQPQPSDRVRDNRQFYVKRVVDGDVQFEDGTWLSADLVEVVEPAVPDTVEHPWNQYWWSPTHGLIKEKDGVWWRYEEHLVSLRHDGLPNERPDDAVRLIPAATGVKPEPELWDRTHAKPVSK